MKKQNEKQKPAIFYNGMLPEVKPSAWVSVKELPKERMLPVLIFNGKAPIYSQCVLQATWFLQEMKFKNNTDTVITYDDITHWMPLPEPPSEGKV